jgi:2-methylisocitrate lyase-like PEP mutase family enzyme
MTTMRQIMSERLLTAPGVYDAFTALLAEQAGFEALYLSGASIAYTRLGRSDIGLVSFAEVRDTLAAITERVSRPVIVDADTGFGNALNTWRTVREFERAGAAAIQLEDQTAPKRCGHLDGKSLVSVGEMVGKLHAALDARRSADTLIVARTDAVAVEGFDAALERAERYVEAGADVLFVEAVRSEQQMRVVCERFAARVPLLANMVEGGKTPDRSVDELAAIGYRLAIFPGGTARAVAHALRAYFATLRADGSNRENRGRMLDFDGINALIGTPELLAQGRRFEAAED